MLPQHPLRNGRAADLSSLPVGELLAVLEQLRRAVEQAAPAAHPSRLFSSSGVPPVSRDEPQSPLQLVTLNQMAAMVCRSKATLRHYLANLPPPAVHGRRGQPSLWDWATARPILERLFGRRLAETHPAYGQ